MVVGGITRLIPVTGITLPFVSYGGSSLVSNYILLAILLRISNDNATEQALAEEAPRPSPVAPAQHRARSQVIAATARLPPREEHQFPGPDGRVPGRQSSSSCVFVQLNYLQVFHATSLDENKLNTRGVLAQYQQPRGAIISADGEPWPSRSPATTSTCTSASTPKGRLFGQITGYFSFTYGTDGLEQEYNSAVDPDRPAGLAAAQPPPGQRRFSPRSPHPTTFT